MIVHRVSIFDPWRAIQMGIERLLNWDLEISPLAVDRAIVWCSNVVQQNTLVSLGDYILLVAARVSFRS